MSKIITVAQQKGGAGKTTLVAQLAVAFSSAECAVAVADIDPQGSVTAWHGVRAARPDRSAPIRLATISGWKLDRELAGLGRGHDIVLIDSPPHAETEAKAAIRAADLVLMPVQPSPMDLWAIAPTLALARRHDRPVLIVLNRVPPRGKLSDAMRAELTARDLPVARTALGNRQAFAASLLAGAGVTETHEHSAAAREIAALATEISDRIGTGAA